MSVAAFAPSVRESTDPSFEPVRPLRAPRLLIVDDQLTLARAVENAALPLGAEVRVVTDPFQATEVFLRYKPDVVMIELFMPQRDGIDVLNDVLLTGEKVRVIVTAANAPGYLRLAAAVALFHGQSDLISLPRPYRRADLLPLLESALAG